MVISLIAIIVIILIITITSFFMENTNIKVNTPKEVFLHLLAIVTLYWSAIGFTTLIFQIINLLVADPLLDRYGTLRYAEPMKFAIASLIIVFPVYILVSWFLKRNYLKNPITRELKLRKWLIYFTLFVAALVIIGDLVSIILTLLNGEITSRFILKALSILIVAGIILGYYLDDVRRDRPSTSKNVRYFSWGVCLIVFVVVVSSFFIIGSPQEERLRKFDLQKISDLQNIQMAIVNYWQKKETLPLNLEVLKDNISGFSIPSDPQTGKGYEYIIKDANNLSFELCADFNRDGSTDEYYGISQPVGQYADNWDHAPGRVCFERTIDKELYQVIKK